MGGLNLRPVAPLVLVVSLFLGTPARCANQPPSTPHDRSQAEAKIRQSLKEPTVFEFIEQPLQDVLDSIKERHRIEIKLDKRALDDAGIGTDTPVTRNLRGVSLQSALQLMLHDLDLTWIIENEVLLITTNDSALAKLETRVYDVGDLLDGAHRAKHLVEVIARSASFPEYCFNDQAITPYRNLLLIRTTQHVHAEIEDVLSQMRNKLRPPDRVRKKARRAAKRAKP
jgi:hypothetical protein